MTELLQNPVFTALAGGFLVFLGGLISQFVQWRKEISIVREKMKIEHLKTATEELKQFLKKALINIADINEGHADHARRVKATYQEVLAEDQTKILSEWKSCLENMTDIFTAYFSIRHFLSKDDRGFLDAAYKEAVKTINYTAKNKTHHIDAITNFRSFAGCLYTSLIKNLEHISTEIGMDR